MPQTLQVPAPWYRPLPEERHSWDVLGPSSPGLYRSPNSHAWIQGEGEECFGNQSEGTIGN